MLMLTEMAGEYLTALLENTNASAEAAVRFVLDGSTLTPKLDSTRPGDKTFDYEGRRVLVLDEQVSQALAESTLDVQATEEGPKLVLLQ